MNLSVRTLSGLGTTGTGAKVDIGLFDADGAGNSTYSSQYNDEGTFANASAAGTYSAAQSGRVLINLTGAPVSYLIGPNAGFAIGTNAKVSFGSFEAQASGPFSDGSFSGTYIFGTESTVLQETTVGSGALTADGSGGAVDTEHTNSLQLGLGGETAAPST